MTAPTVEDFTNLVRDLVVSGWTRLPISPREAGFLAIRSWPTGEVDTVLVIDLDQARARRETPNHTPTWTFGGDVNSVRLALASLPPPTPPRGAPASQRRAAPGA